MKLLVTGGLGFIGSNFILKLLNETNEFDIINVDAELYGANKKNLDAIKNHKKYEFPPNPGWDTHTHTHAYSETVTNKSLFGLCSL